VIRSFDYVCGAVLFAEDWYESCRLGLPSPCLEPEGALASMHLFRSALRVAFPTGVLKSNELVFFASTGITGSCAAGTTIMAELHVQVGVIATLIGLVVVSQPKFCAFSS
jgi:hypothetical protein